MSEISSISQTITFLAINLSYALIALTISVIALILIDKYLFKKIDFIAEIKNGNIAAGLFYSVLLIFIGLVVATAIN